MVSPFLVHPSGFEPETDGLENRCSIQLSYGCSSLKRVQIKQIILINKNTKQQ